MTVAFRSRWMEFLPDTGGNATDKTAKSPSVSFVSASPPHIRTRIVENPPRWQAGNRQELGHLGTAEQAAILAGMVKTGAVLVLEGEDGTMYRCHLDGAEMPADIATLPRHELKGVN